MKSRTVSFTLHLSGMPCSHQVRKLEFLLGEAIESGCDTVMTCGSMQSNFCRATAIAAREVGLKSYLFLRMKDTVVRDADTQQLTCDMHILGYDLLWMLPSKP